MCGAMQDVELHELHGVFHGGRSGMAARRESVAAVQQELSSSKRAAKRRKQRNARSHDQAATYTSPRVCWFRNAEDTDGACYREGVGVADWLSKFY